MDPIIKIVYKNLLILKNSDRLNDGGLSVYFGGSLIHIDHIKARQFVAEYLVNKRSL